MVHGEGIRMGGAVIFEMKDGRMNRLWGGYTGNMDLRNSASDGSQRMLNAIEPGSPLPIHRHRKSSETVVCLRGRLVEEFYDELSPGGPVVALNIPIGQWHTVRALESGTVIMEVKDGPYEPTGEEDILAL